MKPEQRYLFFQESVCTEIQDEYPLIQIVSDNGVSSSSLPKKTAENTRWISTLWMRRRWKRTIWR